MLNPNKSLKYDYIKEVAELKKTLYELYQEKLIVAIIEKIQNKLETFSITTTSDTCGVCISLKIKKTNMKKEYSDYYHDSVYYYNIFNDLIYSVYMENYDFIKNKLSIESLNILNNILNSNSIQLLYTTVTLSDNIVNILL